MSINETIQSFRCVSEIPSGTFGVLPGPETHIFFNAGQSVARSRPVFRNAKEATLWVANQEDYKSFEPFETR
jgi:hypothetical protein